MLLLILAAFRAAIHGRDSYATERFQPGLLSLQRLRRRAFPRDRTAQLLRDMPPATSARLAGRFLWLLRDLGRQEHHTRPPQRRKRPRLPRRRVGGRVRYA